MLSSESGWNSFNSQSEHEIARKFQSTTRASKISRFTNTKHPCYSSRYYKNISTSNLKKHPKKASDIPPPLRCAGPRAVEDEPTKNLTSRKRWHPHPLPARKLQLSISGTQLLTFSGNTPTDRVQYTTTNRDYYSLLFSIQSSCGISTRKPSGEMPEYPTPATRNNRLELRHGSTCSARVSNYPIPNP